MTPRTKKTAAALSGALVLASGAYALGSQTGDGQALAGQNANAARQAVATASATGQAPGSMASAAARARTSPIAAQKLGVSQDKLRAALKNLRDDRKRQDRRPPRRVREGARQAARHRRGQGRGALDKRAGDRQGGRKLKRDGRRGDMRDAFAKQLAAKLGITAAKVRSALDAQRKAGPPGPPDLSAPRHQARRDRGEAARRARRACGPAPALGRAALASPASTAAAPATRRSARSPRISASARPSSRPR